MLFENTLLNKIRGDFSREHDSIVCYILILISDSDTLSAKIVGIFWKQS